MSQEEIKKQLTEKIQAIAETIYKGDDVVIKRTRDGVKVQKTTYKTVK